MGKFTLGSSFVAYLVLVEQRGQEWVNNFHMDYHEERWAPSEAACPERCRCSWTGRGTGGPPSCCNRSSQFPTPLSRISTLRLVNQLSAINSNGVKKHLVRPFCYILIPLFGDISLAYLCCAIIVVLFRGAFKWTFWKNLGFCPNQVDPPQWSNRPKWARPSAEPYRYDCNWLCVQNCCI